MSDFFDELESTSNFSGAATTAYPFIVHGYVDTDIDSSKHYIIGERADLNDGRRLHIFLDPNDPTEGKEHRRPRILDFHVPRYVEARKNNDIATIEALSKAEKLRTHVDIGGIILADGIVSEDDNSVTTRWIRRVKQSPSSNDLGLIGWVAVRPTNSGSFEVEFVHQEDITNVTNYGDMIAAVQKHVGDRTGNREYGTPAVYLRAYSKPGSDPIVLGAKDKDKKWHSLAGRQDFRDRRVGENKFVPVSTDEHMRVFMAGPLISKLNKEWDAGAQVEVVPVTILHIGKKTLERGRDLSAPFTIPDGPTPKGFAHATTRVSRVDDNDTGEIKGYLASLCVPVSGDLYPIDRLPTPGYDPQDYTAARAIFRKREAQAGAGEAAAADAVDDGTM